MMEAEVTNEVALVKPTFEMEIKVEIPKVEKVEHNLDLLKEHIIKLKEYYSKLVFTDEQTKDAENERKNLNALLKKVEDLRKENVKKYKKPIDDFENTAKDIEKLIKSAREDIQVFIDKAEEKRRKEKDEKIIKPIINSLISEAFVKGYLVNKDEIIYDNRWFNKTFKDADIEKDIKGQIEEIMRKQDELNQGLEVIKSNLDAYKRTQDYDKYAERFKYTRDLTGVLNDIKNDNLKTVSGNLNVFDKAVTEKDIDNSKMFDMPREIMITKTFRGTERQMELLSQYAYNLGMEVVVNGY